MITRRFVIKTIRGNCFYDTNHLVIMTISRHIILRIMWHNGYAFIKE